MKFTLKYIIPILIIGTSLYFNYTGQISWNPSEYLTFALIILTYFYVVFTWETVNRMKEESYLERRPYLIADFISDKSELTFYLKNIGRTPAKNVKIKIVPDILKFDGYSLNKEIFNKPINFFPPQKILETYIEETSKYFDKNPDQYKVVIEYSDSFKNNYLEEIELDLNHHKKQSYVVEKEIKHIVKSLEDLNKTISGKNAL